jgi:SAM-dependent methyltransferase
MAKSKKLPWNEQFAIAWEKLAPPARPSQTEQRFYEKIIKRAIKDNKNPKILILGSTPELRDVLLKNKIKPICCDINRDVFKSLRKLMKYHNRKERFILSDWTKLAIKEKFDLILGHQVINMLPFKKQILLLKNIYRSLKSGGMFINSLVLRTKDKNISLLSGFKRYRKFNKITIKNSFSAIHPDLLLAISRKNGIYSPKDCLRVVENLYQSKKINKKERDIYFKIMPPSDLKVFVPSKEGIEVIMKKNFKIIDIYYCSSRHYDSQYWPVYVLKK